MTSFATNLRLLRNQKGISRYALGKLAGLSWEGVAKLERRGSDPKLSTLYKVAAALGVTVCDLLLDCGTPDASRGKRT
jgi:transcriptional regulator with XRE-family HTH domain